MRFLENQKRELVKRKAQHFYDRARQLYLTSDIKRPGTILLRMSHAIEDFFATLDQPITSNRDLVSDGQIPTKDASNERYSNMVTDLDITFAEQNALELNMISSFNYTQLQKNAIDEDLEQLEGLIDEAEQAVGGETNVAIRFFDNFSSTDFVDLLTNPVTSESIAFVDTIAGVLHLGKNAEIDVIDDGDIIQEFSYLASQTKKPIDLSKSIIGGIINRHANLRTLVSERDAYNGKMYGLTFSAGNSLVEDGIRVDLSNADDQTNALLKMVDTEGDSVGESVTTIWEREFTLLDFELNKPFKDINGANTINVDDIVISEEVVDPHPEYNIRVKRIPFTEGQLPGGRTDVRNVGRGAGGAKPVRPDHLRFVWGEMPSNVENAELMMILMLTFKVSKRVSRLTLDPHLFGKGVSPRIEKVDVYEPSLINDDGSLGGWVSAVTSANVAASNLNDDSKDVLDSTRSWILGNKDVSSIRITLRQNKGYRQKYELLAFFGKTFSAFPSAYGDRAVTNLQYLIDYMGHDFITKVENNVRNIIGDALKNLDPTLNSVNRAHRVDSIVASALDTALGDSSIVSIGQNMMNKALWKRATKIITSEKLGRGTIKGEDKNTPPRTVVIVPSEISNRYRFAIGIRDIDVKYTEYKESSEILTRQFLSPVPIGSIVLRTEELIPPSFADAKLTLAQLGDQSSLEVRPWITYEVSVDGGLSFHPISPLGGQKWKLRLEDGKKLFQVPTFIEVNSDTPIGRRSIYEWGPLGYIDTPNGISPKTIMMRIRLERPKSELGSFYTGLTPRLDAYELLVNPGPAGGKP